MEKEDFTDLMKLDYLAEDISDYLYCELMDRLKIEFSSIFSDQSDKRLDYVFRINTDRILSERDLIKIVANTIDELERQLNGE